jgi:HEAT repeat protein
MRRYPKLGLAAIVVLSLVPSVARGQGFTGGYTLPGYSGDASSAPGDPLRQRYNKAKNGANLSEWVNRLGDDEPEKRLEAVKSLGDSGDGKANDYLMQAVGDPDPRVSSKAVEYLGKVRATDATTFLIQRLFMTGTKEPLRHRILMALGKIGDPRASQPILEFVQRDLNPDIRGTGLYAVGEIGDASVLQELRAIRETEADRRLQRVIDEAVTKIASRQATEVRDPDAFPTALDAALARDDLPKNRVR